MQQETKEMLIDAMQQTVCNTKKMIEKKTEKSTQ